MLHLINGISLMSYEFSKAIERAIYFHLNLLLLAFVLIFFIYAVFVVHSASRKAKTVSCEVKKLITFLNHYENRSIEEATTHKSQ